MSENLAGFVGVVWFLCAGGLFLVYGADVGFWSSVVIGNIWLGVACVIGRVANE